MITQMLRQLAIRYIPPPTRVKILDLAQLRPLRRWHTVRTSDYFLISYPKCGRTWLRIMLTHAIAAHHNMPVDNFLSITTLHEQNPEIPKIIVTHDNQPHWKKPHQLKSNKSQYQHAGVIFLVRDPRDVIVSLYFQKSKRENKFTGSLDDFLQEPVGGFDTLLQYYNIWLQNQHVPHQFLLVKYETLRQTPTTELRRIVDFLGFNDISDDTLNQAVEYAAFGNMRKMEMENKLASERLAPGDNKDPESFKTRKGKVGGYTEYLSDAQIAELNRKMATQLSDQLGYNDDLKR